MSGQKPPAPTPQCPGHCPAQIVSILLGQDEISMQVQTSPPNRDPSERPVRNTVLPGQIAPAKPARPVHPGVAVMESQVWLEGTWE